MFKMVAMKNNDIVCLILDKSDYSNWKILRGILKGVDGNQVEWNKNDV